MKQEKENFLRQKFYEKYKIFKILGILTLILGILIIFGLILFFVINDVPSLPLLIIIIIFSVLSLLLGGFFLFWAYKNKVWSTFIDINEKGPSIKDLFKKISTKKVTKIIEEKPILIDVIDKEIDIKYGNKDTTISGYDLQYSIYDWEKYAQYFPLISYKLDTSSNLYSIHTHSFLLRSELQPMFAKLKKLASVTNIGQVNGFLDNNFEYAGINFNFLNSHLLTMKINNKSPEIKKNLKLANAMFEFPTNSDAAIKERKLLGFLARGKLQTHTINRK